MCLLAKGLRGFRVCLISQALICDLCHLVVRVQRVMTFQYMMSMPSVAARIHAYVTRES